MPFRPEHSLLRVEVPVLHTIDTTSVENLFGMWSLFSKTAHAMEDGKRLENLSWRLWNRETFCCDAKSQARSTFPTRHACTARPKAVSADFAVPALSSSLDSASSEEMEDDHEEPSHDDSTPSDLAASVTIPQARPELRRSDSVESRSRGREKHITPVDLEKIVISIKETQHIEPITDLPMLASSRVVEKCAPPTPSASQELSNLRIDSASPTEPSQDTTPHPASITTSQATLLESSASTFDTHDDRASSTVGSEDSSHTGMSAHSIVRGFVAGGAPSSYRSQTNLATMPAPILKKPAAPMHSSPPKKKKGAMFTIGTSSGEEESSLESHMYKSSLSESLRRTDGKKQASFKEEVSIARPPGHSHSTVFESDDEDEEVSESAIEDEDDSSDWEDSDDASGPSSMNERELFQRVDSRPNLTSRRSLLTSLMHEPDRAKALAAQAASRSTPAMRRSRTTSPNGPSTATHSGQHGPAPPQTLVLPPSSPSSPPPSASQAKPIIMTTSNTHAHQLALSPRTTRRNMLSTELTESLRKNLLWERQHRSTGNLAALKRRHTSMDVKNLRAHVTIAQNAEPAPLLSHPDGPKGFTNEYFNHGLQEYHQKGW